MTAYKKLVEWEGRIEVVIEPPSANQGQEEVLDEDLKDDDEDAMLQEDTV